MDGLSTVVEKNNLFNNGKNNSTISSYKLDKYGNKIPIEYNTAIEDFKYIK